MRLYDVRPHYAPCELEQDSPFDYEPLETRAQKAEREAAEAAALAPVSVVDLCEALYRSLVEARERRMVRS